MKRFLFLLVVFALIFGGGNIALGEDTKKFVSSDGTSITLPEMAPDLDMFKFAPMGSREFSGGNAIFVYLGKNKDESVIISLLLVRIGDRAHFAGIAVSYNGADAEIMEDVVFMESGKPSGKLVRVKKGTTINRLVILLDKTAI